MTGTGPEYPATSEWQRYQRGEAGVALRMPPDWTVEDDPSRGVSFVALAPADGEEQAFRPNVTVVVENVDAHDLDEAVRNAIGQMELLLTDLRVLDYEETEVDGRPARRLLSTYRQGLYSLTLEQWYLLVPGRLVVVSATSETLDYDRLAVLLAAVATSVDLGDG